MMQERIDLSAVPSQMELLAQSWCGSAASHPPVVRQSCAVKSAPALRARQRAVPVVAIDDSARRARDDAMRAVARDVPNPKSYARLIPLVEAEALVNAERGNNGWRYRVDIDPALLAKLRLVGLAYLEDRGLTLFACAVRRVLVEERL